MPIYEYSCDACGHELEALQAFSDEPLTQCPACGKPQLRKLISAAAFRLKGGGWYETDFKKGNQRNLAGDGKGSESSAKAEGGKSGEAKKSEGGKSDKAAGGASKSGGESKKTASS